MANKKIWCAFSGHGFGHFSQVYPILNQLSKELLELEVFLAGSIPQKLIDGCLHFRTLIYIVNRISGWFSQTH
ncbi:MAG: hypothetical protein HQL71_09685 [Magnetococcales bacterium]|nr:hypothetical protein [Magnetococcales bacterium]